MKKKQSSVTLSWLSGKTRRYFPMVALLAVVNAVIALAFVRLALLSKELIDAASVIITNPPVGDMWAILSLPEIYSPAGKVIGIILLQVALNILSSNIRVRIAGKIEMSLRRSLYLSLLNKEYVQTAGFHSGEILNRLTSDISVVVSGITGLVPSVVSLLTKLIGGLVVLTMISPGFTVAFLILAAVVLFVGRIYGVPLKRLHKKCQETDGKTRSFVQESIENLLTVKAFANSEAMEDRLTLLQQDNYRQKVRRNTVNNIGNTGMYLLMTAAYYVALLWGVLCLVSGTMTFGTLTALLQIFEQLRAPLRNASGLMPQYFAMMASADRLRELEALPDEMTPEAPDSGNLLSGFRCLSLKNLSFAYDADTPVLDNVNLSVGKGEIVALIGESGIGKSTLMKLVLAILIPQAGCLILNCDGRTVPVSVATRRFFAYVPQGNTVFAGSLRENVTFFRKEYTAKQVQEALELACLDEFANSLPEGLDTLVGEHGFGISEGQAQRIAIARALLDKAPVLLLDECTSALDTVTEQRLLKNIRGTGRTVLMISHKNTAVSGSDRVYRLVDRHITEESATGSKR